MTRAPKLTTVRSGRTIPAQPPKGLAVFHDNPAHAKPRTGTEVLLQATQPSGAELVVLAAVAGYERRRAHRGVQEDRGGRVMIVSDLRAFAPAGLPRRERGDTVDVQLSRARALATGLPQCSARLAACRGAVAVVMAPKREADWYPYEREGRPVPPAFRSAGVGAFTLGDEMGANGRAFLSVDGGLSYLDSSSSSSDSSDDDASDDGASDDGERAVRVNSDDDGDDDDVFPAAADDNDDDIGTGWDDDIQAPLASAPPLKPAAPPPVHELLRKRPARVAAPVPAKTPDLPSGGAQPPALGIAGLCPLPGRLRARKQRAPRRRPPTSFELADAAVGAAPQTQLQSVSVLGPPRAGSAMASCVLQMHGLAPALAESGRARDPLGGRKAFDREILGILDRVPRGPERAGSRRRRLSGSRAALPLADALLPQLVARPRTVHMGANRLGPARSSTDITTEGSIEFYGSGSLDGSLLDGSLSDGSLVDGSLLDGSLLDGGGSVESAGSASADDDPFDMRVPRSLQGSAMLPTGRLQSPTSGHKRLANARRANQEAREAAQQFRAQTPESTWEPYVAERWRL